MLRTLALAGLAVISTPALAGEGHCESNEDVVFSCSVGKKTVSVCASPDITPDSGYIQYRFGPIGTPELSYPENPSSFRAVADAGSFFSKYSSGGWMRFANGGYRYLVYSHEWQSDGGEDGGITQGIAVLKDGKRIAKLDCSSAAVSYFELPIQNAGMSDSSDDQNEAIEEIIGAYK